MDRDKLKTELRNYIANEILNRKDFPFSDDEPLLSGGVMDSFAMAQLAVFIEEQYSVSIPDSRLAVDELDTINDMAEMVISLYA